MQSTLTDQIIQFIPLMTLQLFYAAVVFVVARKQHKNPWIWTACSLIPGLGFILAGVFMLLSYLSVLDRLNVLERESALQLTLTSSTGSPGPAACGRPSRS